MITLFNPYKKPILDKGQKQALIAGALFGGGVAAYRGASLLGILAGATIAGGVMYLLTERKEDVVS